MRVKTWHKSFSVRSRVHVYHLHTSKHVRPVARSISQNPLDEMFDGMQAYSICGHTGPEQRVTSYPTACLLPPPPMLKPPLHPPTNRNPNIILLQRFQEARKGPCHWRATTVYEQDGAVHTQQRLFEAFPFLVLIRINLLRP